jgi:DNA polymerase I-like protein with 3'-5' exonuclease and polymerase domains
MLAHHTLYPSLPHNLGFITTQYTDHPYYKDEKDDWKDVGDIDEFWRYNGKDCCNTLAASQKMHKELIKQGLDEFFFNHVMRLQPHLARMTIGGVLIDTKLKENIRSGLVEDCAERLAKFHQAVRLATGLDDYAPNPKSPVQLGDLFFRRLKLVGRGTSTDAANRKRMYEHPRTNDLAKDVITSLDGYLREHKFLTTYAEMEIDPDGRARSEYKQTGVQSAPGRLSSSKVMWGSGMNFQNQPSRAYPMFIADPGFGIGYFDASQAEARLVAYFADIPLWKEQFERARLDGVYDAHRALAGEMFSIPYDEVPTADEVTHDDGSIHKTIRFIAKRCRHGLNYRMGPDRLAQTTGLSLGEAYKAYNAYHRATPEIKVWWGKIEREVRDTKNLFNAYGRRWTLLERLSPEALESIVAYKPQSTLGDHICRVIYKCHEDDRWPLHARIWLNVHDALLCLAPLDKLKTCIAIMKEHAETPIVIKGEPLIIPADTKISYPDDDGIHRWSTLKKWKVGE